MPILTMIMLVTVVSISLLYGKIYAPSAKTYETYLAVHHEFEIDEISHISINSSNHKVNIKKSNDEKIKIVYYQKSDNVNTFTSDDKKIVLNMVEKAENLENLFFKPEKKIDTITVYLPEQSSISMTVNAIDGPLTVKNVVLNSLSYENAYGDMIISGLTCERLFARLNTGDVDIDNCLINQTTINLVTGNVNIDFQNELNNYSHDYTTTYGSISLNGVKQTITNEDGDEVTAHSFVENCENSDCLIKVMATRSTINITGLIVEQTENEEAE